METPLCRNAVRVGMSDYPEKHAGKMRSDRSFSQLYKSG